MDRGTSRVLNGVSMSLHRGDTVALQGASGSGKSTLLALLSGLLRPDSGVIEIQGRPFSDQADRVRSRTRLRSMGLVFQGDEFLPELSLTENISLPLRLAGSKAAPRTLESILTPLLQRLGIGDLGSRMPSEVSGGQLQRAAVARAIVHRPSIVLADEPTGSLDDISSRNAMTLLLEAARDIGSAVLVVTHSDEVADLCASRLYLQDGIISTRPARPSRPSFV